MRPGWLFEPWSKSFMYSLVALMISSPFFTVPIYNPLIRSFDLAYMRKGYWPEGV